jgi:DNA polymerase-3 subunit delta
VVVVQELQELSNKDQKRLAAPLSSVGAGTTLVATTSPPSGRFDRKPKLAADLLRAVEKTGEIRDCFSPPERQLVPWVMAEARLHGKRLTPDAASLLLETVGADCDRLAPEVAKLALYVGAAEEIADADVRASASPADDSTVFDLVDAIGRKDLPRALDFVRALLPKEARRGAGIPLLGMIARHLRLLWQAVTVLKGHASLDSPVADDLRARLPQETNLLEAVRGKSFLVRKYAQQARNFTDAQLARAIVKVYEADLALKGFGEAQMDDRMVIETLVIALCRK